LSDIDDFKGGKLAHNSAIIILDESGDLGFSPHSSRYFVVAATIVHETDNMVRLAKKVRNSIRGRKWKEELKFNNSEEPTKMLMLKGVAKMDCQILWDSFDKNNIPMNLREDKYLLYQTACEIVLQEAIKRTLAKKIHIIIDKRYSKRSDRDRLELNVMSTLTKNHVGNFSPSVRISQYDSITSRELQVHDFIVGAVFQHLERGVDTYINIIKNKIVFGQRRW
jgi:hypothetical protein